MILSESKKSGKIFHILEKQIHDGLKSVSGYNQFLLIFGSDQFAARPDCGLHPGQDKASERRYHVQTCQI